VNCTEISSELITQFVDCRRPLPDRIR